MKHFSKKLALPLTLILTLVLLINPAYIFAQSDQRVAYNFNENTGTAIDDASSNNSDATATSPTWTTSGRYGNGITFNGTSSRVRSNSDITLTGAFTYGAWIYNPSNQAYETIMTVGGNRDLYLTNGVMAFWNGTTEYTFGSALSTNTWYYVSFVSTGSTISVYVDGTQRGSTQSVTLGSVTAPLQVGAYIYQTSSNADFFSGTIDEVRVHNYALTTTQIGQDRDAAIGSSDTTAPTLSGGSPTGTQSSSTTSVSLQVTTNESATCRYSTTANTAYASMTNTFSTTGSTSHSTTVSGLTSKNHRYYVRCQDTAGNATTSDYTITFTIPAGTLGSWTTTNGLSNARSINGATYANGYVYLVGGADSNGTAISTVSYAPVNSNGTLGTWDTTTSLPSPRRSTTPVFNNGYIYLTGGADNNSTLTTTVYYAPVNTNGTIGTWSTTTALPQANLSHGTVINNGYIYVVGGNPDPCITTVRYAPINSNGTIGTWSTANSLPAARCGIVEAVTVNNGSIYVVGGFNNTDSTNTIYYASFNSDGSLGTWQTNTNTLSNSRIYTGAVAYNDTLYVVGGQTGGGSGPTASVEQAQINPDGTVGTFSSSTSLPAARVYMGIEAVNGYIYVIDGGTGIGGISPTTTAYYAATNGSSPDSTAPTVSVTAPSNGATVSGSVTVSANASDNVGVSGVQFLLDGNNLGSEDTTSPYSISWTTSSATNGAHTITARARDAAANQTTSSSVSVTVSNTSSSDERVAYNFNENTGTAINDSSTNDTDATATSPTWTTSGQYSNAITFNGTTSRVRSNSDIALNGAFTIEGWMINPSNQSWETLFSVGQSRNLYLASGVLNFSNGSTNVSFGSALTTNTWQHVAIVSSGTTVSAYVNGVQRGTTQNMTNSSVTAPFQIGAWIYNSSNADYFSGTIDDVRLYNRALSATEITTDMNTAIGSGGADTTPPTRSAGSPSGSLTAGTTQTNLQLTTNEAATCRYSTTANTAYASMTNTFSTTGSTSHSTQVTGLSNGTSYNYYVRCQDSSSNANTSDYTISFSVASSGGSNTYALRFYGSQVNDIDRVKIPLTTNRTIDVGGNMTVEWNMRAATGNTSGTCTTGNYEWVFGNILIDRDVDGTGDNGDYGISLYGGRIAFGVSAGGTASSMCSTSSVNDGNWHHVAVTRSTSTGQMCIYIDGTQDSCASGPTGDMSYRDARSTNSPNDVYLVLGAEKHDYASSGTGYRGWMDELRVSNSIRYTANFTAPTAQLTADSNTVALYHFNDGTGTTLTDTTGDNNGTLSVGGSPNAGPAWDNSTLPF